MKPTKNIVIAGVGGQGTLLVSKLMGKYYMEKGFDVKVSEVHGMSQRGGSVVTYVRYGEKVYSPLVDQGEADIVMAFEQLEAARWLPHLKKGGVLIANTQKIMPMPVISGQAEYPENLMEKLKDRGIQMISLDALSLANQAGNAKTVNMVLLGVMAKYLGESENEWIRVIEKLVTQNPDTNKRAFMSGYQFLN